MVLDLLQQEKKLDLRLGKCCINLFSWYALRLFACLFVFFCFSGIFPWKHCSKRSVHTRQLVQWIGSTWVQRQFSVGFCRANLTPFLNSGFRHPLILRILGIVDDPATRAFDVTAIGFNRFNFDGQCFRVGNSVALADGYFAESTMCSLTMGMLLLLESDTKEGDRIAEF